ncbi:MAG TPA: flagellar export protein FliJ [Gemmatimonadaceae bacterium]|nr:flagellar export protein FliJ [Gemmatimonadaceae bacterium]
MSAFKFRLQQVLHLREQEEQVVAARLAEAETAADDARIAQKALESIRQAGSTAIRDAHAAEPTVGQLKTIGYVIEQLNHHIVDAQARVDMAEQLVDQARTDLTSALQARRVLSRLRDRHFTSWKTDENATELREMDELALSRFSRRENGSTPGAASA